MGCTSSKPSVVQFHDIYLLGDKLGEGGFATVNRATKTTKAPPEIPDVVAVKIIDRKKLDSDGIKVVLEEVEIMKALIHPNIVRFFNFFENPSSYFIVLELMAGGELFDSVARKTHYNEFEARVAMKHILDGILNCHTNSIIHRDLKPENLLMEGGDGSAVKLADFGLAARAAGVKKGDICGTPDYMAPEMLKGQPYGVAVDMWSVGVIMYILLGGYAPFSSDKAGSLKRLIMRGVYEFHADYWSNVSEDAKDLISSLLKVDPALRLTAQQALNHSWMRAPKTTLSVGDLGANLRTFRRYNAKRKIIAAAKAVIAVGKFNRIAKELSQRSLARGAATTATTPNPLIDPLIDK